MGLGPFGFRGSSSSFDEPCSRQHFDPNPANPNPSDYKIVYSVEGYGHLAIEIKYNGCTNYEGKKLLVFKNTTLSNLQIRNNCKIDPHFSDNKNWISPIARFEPTREGWELALKIMKEIK